MVVKLDCSVCGLDRRMVVKLECVSLCVLGLGRYDTCEVWTVSPSCPPCSFCGTAWSRQVRAVCEKIACRLIPRAGALLARDVGWGVPLCCSHCVVCREEGYSSVVFVLASLLKRWGRPVGLCEPRCLVNNACPIVQHTVALCERKPARREWLGGVWWPALSRGTCVALGLPHWLAASLPPSSR